MAEKLTFDHYEVLTREDGAPFELGRGAMGITYKAFDTNLRVNVALKVINAKFLESEIAQQRFLREARAAAQLRHPNVASVYHLGTSADAFFYAMEFVDGETVESFIKRQGSIDPVIALRITLQVARALAAAEKVHLVHRDIKPANLMLVREDDDFLVKVIDFGLAKSIKHEEDDDLATLSMGGFVGTAHFASPEQLEEKEIDIRSDIYSLGVTLWYMLAGQAPFGGSLAQVMSQHLHKPPPLEKLQNLPECVRGAVGHMIEKDPAARPQTPSALRGELENCLALLAAGAAPNEQDFPTMVEVPVAPAPELHPPPLPQAKSSSRGMIWGALLLVVLLGAGLLFFLKTRQPVSAPPAVSVPPTPPPVVAQATLAPSAPPAPSLEESPGLTREAIAEAEKFEAAQDWPRAITAYVTLQKKFPPAVCAHENPVAQREPAGRGSEKLHRGRGRSQGRIFGRRDAGETKQPHAFRLAHAESACIRHFLLRKRHAFAQDARLERFRPARRQRDEPFELREHELSIHETRRTYLTKRNRRGRRCSRGR